MIYNSKIKGLILNGKICFKFDEMEDNDSIEYEHYKRFYVCVPEGTYWGNSLTDAVKLMKHYINYRNYIIRTTDSMLRS